MQPTKLQSAAFVTEAMNSNIARPSPPIVNKVKCVKELGENLAQEVNSKNVISWMGGFNLKPAEKKKEQVEIKMKEETEKATNKEKAASMVVGLMGKTGSMVKGSQVQPAVVKAKTATGISYKMSDNSLPGLTASERQLQALDQGISWTLWVDGLDL